ncbi:hypothetical protein QJS66_05235 [Kocuria rhizophila]|nr:hypothetical protein QJS66_05235 [Kocuria rhizophila]
MTRRQCSQQTKASSPGRRFPEQEQPSRLSHGHRVLPDDGEKLGGRGRPRATRPATVATLGSACGGHRLAARGADVAINVPAQEQSDAEDTQQWIEKAGRKVAAADLREESQARRRGTRPPSSSADWTSWSTTRASSGRAGHWRPAGTEDQEMDLVSKTSRSARRVPSRRRWN